MQVNGPTPLSVQVADWVYAVDSFLDRSNDSNAALPVFGGTSSPGEFYQAEGQAFTAVGISLSAIEVKMEKTGSPSDNLTLSITSTLGDTPIGSVTIPQSGITNGVVSQYTFSVPLPLVIGQTYYMEFSRSGGYDTSNYSGPYASFVTGGFGNPEVYSYGIAYTRHNTAWSPQSGYRISFKQFYVGQKDMQILDVASYRLSVNDTVTVSESTFHVITPLIIGEITDLITNGGFVGSASGWDYGSDWTYDTNKMTYLFSLGNSMNQEVPFINGAFYQVSFDITGGNGSQIDISLSYGGVNGGLYQLVLATNGYHLFDSIAGDASGGFGVGLTISPNGWNGSITNISVIPLSQGVFETIEVEENLAVVASERSTVSTPQMPLSRPQGSMEYSFDGGGSADPYIGLNIGGGL